MKRIKDNQIIIGFLLGGIGSIFVMEGTPLVYIVLPTRALLKLFKYLGNK